MNNVREPPGDAKIFAKNATKSETRVFKNNIAFSLKEIPRQMWIWTRKQIVSRDSFLYS